MNGLMLFLAGTVLAVIVEPMPKWAKTAVWMILVVLGIMAGALDMLVKGAK